MTYLREELVHSVMLLGAGAALLLAGAGVGYLAAQPNPRVVPPDDGMAWSCWRISRTAGTSVICCRPAAMGGGQVCRED